MSGRQLHVEHFKNLKCRHLNYGVLVGLYSSQHGQDIQLVEDLTGPERGLLTLYREKLARKVEEFQRMKRCEPHGIEEWLYHPHLFSLWGSFDVGLITLIDDFEVATRLGKCANITAQQFLVHAIPDLRSALLPSGAETLIRDPASFYSKTAGGYRDYPIIGIVQIKLNALLRIACGNELLLRAIYRILDCCGKVRSKDSFRILALESLGWNELTVIMHARTFNQMAALIELVRSSTFGDIGIELGEDSEAFKSIRDFYSNLENLRRSHLVATTRTICGQPWDRYYSIRTGEEPATESVTGVALGLGDVVEARYSVTCKPGHSGDVLNSIPGERLLRSDKPEAHRIVFGKTDLLLQSLTGTFETAEFARKYAETTASVLSSKTGAPRSNTYHSATEIVAPILNQELTAEGLRELQRPVEHGDVYQTLSRLSVEGLVDSARQHLIERLRFPKAVVTESLHMSSMLHMCLTDPLVFDLFLDFLPLFESTFRMLQDEDGSTALQTCKNLEHFVEHVGHSITSRYDSTYATAEITDLSVQLKGAYQDLVCAVTGFLHSALECSVAPNSWALPIILGVRSPECYDWLPAPIIRMNHFDLIQPEGLLQLLRELGFAYLKLEPVRKELAKVSEALWELECAKSGVPAMENVKYLARALRAGDPHEKPARLICDIYSFYVGCAGSAEMFAKHFWLSHSRSGYYALEDESTRRVHCIRFFTALALTDDRMENPSPQDMSTAIGRWVKVLDLENLSPIFRDYKVPLGGLRFAEEVVTFVHIMKTLDFSKVANELRIINDGLKNEFDWKSWNIERAEDELGSANENFSFCRSALLRYFTKIWNSDEDGKQRWIERDAAGDPILREQHAKYLVDLRGGTFVIDPAIRKEYFQARMQLFYSLLDYSHKARQTIIKKYLGPSRTQ